MPIAFRFSCAACEREVVIQVGEMEPVTCAGCGLDYDNVTGERLPVCEGVGAPGSWLSRLQ